jgi:hypothetical protein
VSFYDLQNTFSYMVTVKIFTLSSQSQCFSYEVKKSILTQFYACNSKANSSAKFSSLIEQLLYLHLSMSFLVCKIQSMTHAHRGDA